MKNKFSFRRIGLMLKADWIEYKKAFLLFAGLLMAAHLFLFIDTSDGLQGFLFVAGVFSTLTAFYIFTGWKAHRARHRLLTLPASTFEKYIELLAVCLILFVVFALVSTIAAGIVHFYAGEKVWLLSVFSTPNTQQSLKVGLGIIGFICTFQFMCCISIRKFALGVGTLGLFLYAMVMAYSTYILVKIEGLDATDGMNFNAGFMRSNAFIEMLRFINEYNALCMGLAACVLLYISYLKLKEKQIR